MTGPITLLGNSSGVVGLTTGTGPLGFGLPMTIHAGDGTTNAGGQLMFSAGNAPPDKDAGSLIFQGGYTRGIGIAGNLEFRGGSHLDLGGKGGNLILTGGLDGTGVDATGEVIFRKLKTITPSDIEGVWNNMGVLNIGTGFDSASKQYVNDALATIPPVDMSDYLPVDGSTAMTGTIKLAGNAVGSVLSLISEGVHPATGSGNYLVAKSADGTTGNGGNIQFSAGATSAAGKYAGSVTFWGGSGGSTADGG